MQVSKKEGKEIWAAIKIQHYQVTIEGRRHGFCPFEAVK
jgi:ribosome modulation factor